LPQRDEPSRRAVDGVMESFFALLQKNVHNTKRRDIREELRIAVVIWIERTYHRRRQEALGRFTLSSTKPS
jgi:putative transposase